MSPQSVALDWITLDKYNANSAQERRLHLPLADGKWNKVSDPVVFLRRLKAEGENAILCRALPATRWMQSRKHTIMAITPDEERELREQLARLLQEHRDLDAAISALAMSPGSDLIQVQRLKKRKLILRDKIRGIEDQLTPDIIA
jgi:hypothetical protein